jgi:hypothetical protein
MWAGITGKNRAGKRVAAKDRNSGRKMTRNKTNNSGRKTGRTWAGIRAGLLAGAKGQEFIPPFKKIHPSIEGAHSKISSFN